MCTIYKTFCKDHGCVHGEEAEELRSGIEKLCSRHKRKVPIEELLQLLDRVDARDSVAYIKENSE